MKKLSGKQISSVSARKLHTLANNYANGNITLGEYVSNILAAMRTEYLEDFDPRKDSCGRFKIEYEGDANAVAVFNKITGYDTFALLASVLHMKDEKVTFTLTRE